MGLDNILDADAAVIERAGHGNAFAVHHIIAQMCIRDSIGEAPDDASLDAYLDRILDGEAGDRSGKIYGLGHALSLIHI